jgi:hypothetical protein
MPISGRERSGRSRARRSKRSARRCVDSRDDGRLNQRRSGRGASERDCSESDSQVRGHILSTPRRANAISNDVPRRYRVGTRREDRAGRRNRICQRSMSVGSHCADCRPSVIELVGKQEGSSRTSLVDLFMSRSGGAPEENLIARRAGSRAPADHPLGTA